MKNTTGFLLLNVLLVLILTTGCDRSPRIGKGVQKQEAKQEETAQVNAVAKAESADLMRQAALDGDLEQVKAFLDAGADPNTPDPDGRMALMFAAFNGHSEVVLELLARGAGIDRRDLMGRTALLYAATGPFPETVKILLDKGAEPNVTDTDEHFSPLMHAAAEGNLDVVKILLEAGADHTLKDVDGDNAESFARQAGHVAVADYLATLR